VRIENHKIEMRNRQAEGFFSSFCSVRPEPIFFFFLLRSTEPERHYQITNFWLLKKTSSYTKPETSAQSQEKKILIKFISSNGRWEVITFH
jgi:hypothetical protein